jgi:hypothetical protein
MQAMGVGAMIVHDQNSAEIYHDWNKPGKFEGRLEKLYDDQAGNRIYRIPRRGASLARVVDGARIRGVRPPTPEIDYASLARYVEAVERGPEAPLKFDRIDTENIRIQTRLEPGQLLLVQETYDPAWKAHAGDRAIPIEKDAVGFLLLDPGPGDHEILLRFGPPLENRMGAAISALALLVIAWLAIRPYRPGLASAFGRRTP